MSRVRRVSAGWLLAGLAACRGGSGPAPEAQPAPLASERRPEVHVLERHGSALVAWREAGATDRVVVHLDPHPDLAWLPDETIARIAASLPGDLASLESDPFVAETDPLARFGNESFLYAASRLGIVSEVVWVVPDGTLEDLEGRSRLVAELLVGRLPMVSEADAQSFHRDGPLLRGSILGVPLLVCALADLPALDAPVLLDIDLAYFTIRSALTPVVEAAPWIFPGQVLDTLAARGVETDLVTIALSTMDGTAPPETRWIARDLRRILRTGPSRDPEAVVRARLDGLRAEAAGPADHAIEIYRELAGMAAEEGTSFYVLARALDAAGRTLEAGNARARAERLDPLLARAELFEAERLWFNRDWAAANDRYEAYARVAPHDGSEGWIRRRRADCLAHLDRPDEALRLLRDAVDAAPTAAGLHAELGALLLRRNELAEAIQHLREARRFAPDAAGYPFLLGGAYFAARRLNDAITELECEAARRPCFLPARRLLATALARAGRMDEAKRQLDAAMRLQPSDPQVRALARRLDSLRVRAVPPSGPR